jgi:hypothetical protein
VNFLAETTAGFVVMVNEWLLPVPAKSGFVRMLRAVAIDAKQHRCVGSGGQIAA